ncbi:MAG: TIM barrel protein [Cryobacterium sp.]|nr:TIM barrel protein [Cryobacterium sp.]
MSGPEAIPKAEGHNLSQRIATAPISFGVFGSIKLDLSPAELLGTMAELGFDGTELGPPGFFGPLELLAQEFSSASLRPVGVYVPLHLAGPEEIFQTDLNQFALSLAELRASGSGDALVILADEGDSELIAAPFRGESPLLNSTQWDLASRRLSIASEMAESVGVNVSFHPHFGTYVEKASEIDRLMETTELSLCLDTGHFLIGGADPLEYLQKYSDRINHLHIKDVRLSVFEAARLSGKRADDDWWNDLACPLGDGDVDLEPIVAELVRTEYSGWLVIEQDRAPVTDSDFEGACSDQEHNRNWLVQRICALS